MNKKALSFSMALVLAVSSFSIASAKGGDKVLHPLVKEKGDIIQKYQELSGGKLKLYMNEDNGLQVFINGKLSDKLIMEKESILSFMEENKLLFGLLDPNASFSVVDIEKDELGFTQVKLNQLIKGIPVRGKDIIVQYNSDGVITNISGTIENRLKDITYIGGNIVSEGEAINIAKQQFKFNELSCQPTTQRQVVGIDDKAYEVYSVNIRYTDPEIGNWDVLVEVSSGKVLNKIDNIRYDGPVTGSGTAVDGTTKPLNLYLSAGSYQMKDATKPMTGQIKTYTANGAKVQPGTLVSNTTNTFTTEGFKSPVSAHYYGGVVYDFYKNMFNRNSIDNNGMNIISTTHYGNAYNNAFWDGSQMVYGDGDGSQFTYLSGDLDVVAHELTHGVTSYTANLNYQDQSGALNESMSDVFGVLVQTYDKYNVKSGGTWTFNSADWVVGDAVYTPNTPGDALRSLADPTLYGQPAHMNNYVNTTSDNGGVHTNSGIPNKAGYLVAKSIGNEKTARIYYRALTTYLTSSSNFVAARNALVQSATDLYGTSSAEVSAVNSAFDSVGIVALSDPYEPNDTLSQSYRVSSGVTYSSYISSSSDVDCYKISATNGYNINVSLTNLPKDYDLYLYDSSGRLVSYSENGSTYSETINYTARYTGTYYIVVEGYNGAYSTTTKYNLKATF